MDSGPPRRIGVWGHVGNGNLGDEAIIAAVIQNIKCYCPGAEICGFAINPQDMRERHRIEAFPIRRSQPSSPEPKPGSLPPRRRLWSRIRRTLIKIPVIHPTLKGFTSVIGILHGILSEISFNVASIEHLRKVNLLIIAGSGQLFDYFGGPWGFPYTLLKWSILAKLLRTDVAFVSVGAGPIKSSLSRFFIKHSLSLAIYRSYRDEGSKRLVEGIKIPGEHNVFPDLAYSMAIPTINCSRATSGPVVGINPLPFFDIRYWPEGNSLLYEAYVAKLTAFASWLVRRGYMILFFSTQLRADPLVICDIKTRFVEKEGVGCQQYLLDWPINTFEDLFSALSLTKMIVATRFHAILFSYLMDKPVLGISYHQKIREAMADLEQSDYCVDINEIALESLVAKFISLETNAEYIQTIIHRRVADNQLALRKQYTRLFAEKSAN